MIRLELHNALIQEKNRETRKAINRILKKKPHKTYEQRQQIRFDIKKLMSFSDFQIINQYMNSFFNVEQNIDDFMNNIEDIQFDFDMITINSVNELITIAKKNSGVKSSYNRTLSEIYDALDTVMQKITVLDNTPIKSYPNITDNIRVTCDDPSITKKVCNERPQCVFMGNKCKIKLNTKDYRYYLTRIVHEIVKNEFKVFELFTSGIETIIDKNIYQTDENENVIVKDIPPKKKAKKRFN